MKKKTLTKKQCLELANVSANVYKSEDGLAKHSKKLSEFADYLLGVGPGKKVDGLRSCPPKGEVLLSGDFISEVVRPALLARSIV